MKLNNKGQSALEYLMTYGWALVVIVVVVAALVLLVGNPAQAGDTCSGPGSNLNITNQELGISGWNLKASNISGRTMGNTASGPVYVQGVTIPAPTSPTGYPAVPNTLSPGSTTTVTGGGTFAAGTRYRTDFNATWNDGDFNRTVTWSCSGTA